VAQPGTAAALGTHRTGRRAVASLGADAWLVAGVGVRYLPRLWGISGGDVAALSSKVVGGLCCRRHGKRAAGVGCGGMAVGCTREPRQVATAGRNPQRSDIPQEVVGPAGGAVVQQQPRGCSLRGQEAVDVLVNTEWHAENHKALAIAWQRPVPSPDWFSCRGRVCGLLSSCVPNPGFATVKLDALMLAKRSLANVLQLPDALGNCDDINVVEVGKDGLDLLTQSAFCAVAEAATKAH